MDFHVKQLPKALIGRRSRQLMEYFMSLQKDKGHGMRVCIDVKSA